MLARCADACLARRANPIACALRAALGYDDWPALRVRWMRTARVALEFEALLAARGRHQQAPDALATYWHALPEAGEAGALGEAGFVEAEQADGRLRDFARAAGGAGAVGLHAGAPGPRAAGAARRPRRASQQPMLALRRLLALLQAHAASRLPRPARRTASRAGAAGRCGGGSALLAERLAAHPLLLDELLDARGGRALAGARRFARGLRGGSRRDDDAEPRCRHSTKCGRPEFPHRAGDARRRQSAADSAQQLAWLADGVVARVLALAERESARARTHRGARFAVLGYGSLGGEELGFGSDLDLVFLYDARVAARRSSDGARPLDATRWFARLAQKIVALLGTVTGAGRLFDVDVRLRPDGAKGLLVSSLASFADYQRERAGPGNTRRWCARASSRRRCTAGAISSACATKPWAAHAIPQVRDGRRGDAPAHARRTRSQR